MASQSPAASRRPGAFSMPSSPARQTSPRASHQRSSSSGSDSSGSSQVTATSSDKRNQYVARPSIVPSPCINASTSSQQNFSRPSIAHVVSDTSRKGSPLNPGTDRVHRRNHSQGFFEPFLPSAHLTDALTMSGLTASQIAAQAAMQQQQGGTLHIRRRSQTIPSPQPPSESTHGRQKPMPQPNAQASAIRNTSTSGLNGSQYQHGSLAGAGVTAATAASAAVYPRGAQLSPVSTAFSQDVSTEKDLRSKTERARKIFAKPMTIGTSGSKDPTSKDKPPGSPVKLPSPGINVMPKNLSASATSLPVEPILPSSASIYSTTAASTSTLVPLDRQKIDEKEKSHRHNFLSRQKHKLKDRIEDHSLTLSSASSNSRPTDPNAPQSIYSFAPSSPGAGQGAFSKSVSGLDLRHAGRALREKKREEKVGMPPLESKKSDVDYHTNFGPASTGSNYASGAPAGTESTAAGLQGFGLTNMTAEDAWDLLKAKLLVIFEGEELRIPVEDLNRLVTAHIQRCVQRRTPTILTEDLRELLQTGFASLEQTLRGIPEDRLVPHLVDMWLFVFGTVLPYVQAVFLPLDLEFKGHGGIMSMRDAAEFWGIVPGHLEGVENDLEVRRIVLLSYRDCVILPRHEILKAVFSRLSLESINVGMAVPSPIVSPRPGTAGSLDPGLSSYNSQGSTLLGDGRSRGNSNTSAPELPTFAPPVRVTAQPDSSQVTELVGRMLQCLSVLVSVQSGDDPQAMMEDLTTALKLNWLGRGRTGRNRKGFIGARVPRRAILMRDDP